MAKAVVCIHGCGVPQPGKIAVNYSCHTDILDISGDGSLVEFSKDVLINFLSSTVQQNLALKQDAVAQVLAFTGQSLSTATDIVLYGGAS